MARPSPSARAAAALAIAALAAACGSDATSAGSRSDAASDQPAGDVPWHQQIAEVKARRSWPVDIILCFDCRHRIELRGEIRNRDLVDKELVDDPRVRDVLCWLFECVDLTWRFGEPLHEPNQAFAGVAWLRDGRVVGFPPFLLADRDGRCYAQPPELTVGGGREWAQTVVRMHAVRLVRDEHLDRAARTTGVERARALAAALDALDNESLVMAFYQPEMRAILSLDADGVAGLRDRFAELLHWSEARAALADLVWLFSDAVVFDGPGPPKRVDFASMGERSRRLAAAHADNRFVQQLARALQACSSFENTSREETLARIDTVLAAADPRMREPIQRLRAQVDTFATLLGK